MLAPGATVCQPYCIHGPGRCPRSYFVRVFAAPRSLQTLPKPCLGFAFGFTANDLATAPSGVSFFALLSLDSALTTSGSPAAWLLWTLSSSLGLHPMQAA